MISEDFDTIFDYLNVTNGEKKTILECAEYVEKMGYKDVSDKIKKHFQIVEKPIYNIADSKFYQKALKSNIYLNIQGYVEEENVKYPYVSLNCDIRDLDKFLEAIEK